MTPNAWPQLDARSWAATRKSLHRYAQMLGKLRVALSPDQPNWLFTALALTAHGFTTGPLPWGTGSVQASLDVFSSVLRLECSDGGSAEVSLLPARPVAGVYAEFTAALRALDVDADITTTPQEVPDLTPFHTDQREAAYDAAAVQRWFTVNTAVAGAFDAWRAHFFGRNGIYLWWGGLDLSLMLFSGRHAEAPRDRGYIMRYDLDAELMNVGFYPGDDDTAPFFFGYINPQPPGCEKLPIAPAAASWSTQLGEWVLPYEAVCTSPDPAAGLRAFLDAIYDVATTAGGWDRAALSYVHPPRRAR